MYSNLFTFYFMLLHNQLYCSHASLVFGSNLNGSKRSQALNWMDYDRWLSFIFMRMIMIARRGMERVLMKHFKWNIQLDYRLRTTCIPYCHEVMRSCEDSCSGHFCMVIHFRCRKTIWGWHIWCFWSGEGKVWPTLYCMYVFRILLQLIKPPKILYYVRIY